MLSLLLRASQRSLTSDGPVAAQATILSIVPSRGGSSGGDLLMTTCTPLVMARRWWRRRWVIAAVVSGDLDLLRKRVTLTSWQDRLWLGDVAP